jgi:GDPmannose 4,6-dehydratase
MHLKPGDVVVAVDPRYYRPTEVDLLIGDPSKANNKLGWKPKYNVHTLVEDMMRSDIALMKKDKFLKDSGHEIMRYFE